LFEFEERIDKVTLIPSEGGVFEVSVNGDLVFSKYRLGRHAEPGELVRKVGEKLGAI
jgi:selenoprotein W-related protein